MGASAATTEFLIEAISRGARFDRTGTVGRQHVSVGPGQLASLLRRHGRWPDDLTQERFRALLNAEPYVLDPVLRVLGAEQVTAIDVSDYEGATVVHDLNEPIPDNLRERFTVLFDGGSLEHIFNVPMVLRNYMEMVEVGGHLIIHTTANNYQGHGFYQFSPELFYRALTAENGYAVERVVVVENDVAWRRLLGVPVPFELRAPWYEVEDPARIGDRVLLQNRRPVIIQVQARRTHLAAIFARAPQQSDYAVAWKTAAEQPGPGHTTLTQRLGQRVPRDRQMSLIFDLLPWALAPLKPLVLRQEARRRSLRNGRWYRRVRAQV